MPPTATPIPTPFSSVRRWSSSATAQTGRCMPARIDAGGYFVVNSFQKRCHRRIAVLGPQLGVRRSSGPDFVRRQG